MVYGELEGVKHGRNDSAVATIYTLNDGEFIKGIEMDETFVNGTHYLFCRVRFFIATFEGSEFE